MRFKQEVSGFQVKHHNTLDWVRNNYYLHLLHKENISISTFLKKVQYCVIQESPALHYFQFQLSLAQRGKHLPSFELFLSMWGNENSNFIFPWVMGDVGTCQVYLVTWVGQTLTVKSLAPHFHLPLLPGHC